MQFRLGWLAREPQGPLFCLYLLVFAPPRLRFFLHGYGGETRVLILVCQALCRLSYLPSSTPGLFIGPSLSLDVWKYTITCNAITTAYGSSTGVCCPGLRPRGGKLCQVWASTLYDIPPTKPPQGTPFRTNPVIKSLCMTITVAMIYVIIFNISYPKLLTLNHVS